MYQIWQLGDGLEAGAQSLKVGWVKHLVSDVTHFCLLQNEKIRREDS